MEIGAAAGHLHGPVRRRPVPGPGRGLVGWSRTGSLASADRQGVEAGDLGGRLGRRHWLRTRRRPGRRPRARPRRHGERHRPGPGRGGRTGTGRPSCRRRCPEPPDHATVSEVALPMPQPPGRDGAAGRDGGQHPGAGPVGGRHRVVAVERGALLGRLGRRLGVASELDADLEASPARARR